MEGGVLVTWHLFWALFLAPTHTGTLTGTHTWEAQRQTRRRYKDTIMGRRAKRKLKRVSPGQAKLLDPRVCARDQPTNKRCPFTAVQH